MTTDVRTTKAAIPLDVARAVAGKLIAHLAPHCAQIEIAGSIRRGKTTVGDIELVAIPTIERVAVDEAQQLSLFTDDVRVTRVLTSTLDTQLDRMIAADMLRRDPPPGAEAKCAWGDRYKKVWLHVSTEYGWIQLDLFIATRDNWGAIVAIRTGCSAFSNALVTYIKHQTPYRQRGGNLICVPSGEAVVVPTERAYFATIGVPWIAPEQRDRRAAAWLYGLRWGHTLRYTDSIVRTDIRKRIYERCGLDATDA